MHEEERGLGAAELLGAGADPAQEERRGELAVAEPGRRLVHVVERAKGDDERNDEDEGDREKPEDESRADRHRGIAVWRISTGAGSDM